MPCFRAQVQAQVGSDLVVTRTAGVHFFSDLTNPFNQRGFNIHVNVFQFLPPGKLTCLDLGQDGVQPIGDLITFGLRQHTGARQHRHMGDRPLDIIRGEPLVERHGLGKLLHEPVRGLGKPATPGLLCFVLGCHRQELTLSAGRIV